MTFKTTQILFPKFRLYGYLCELINNIKIECQGVLVDEKIHVYSAKEVFLLHCDRCHVVGVDTDDEEVSTQ